MNTNKRKRSAKDLGTIKEIDRFILAYREQRNLEYIIRRWLWYGIPIPEIYRKKNRG